MEQIEFSSMPCVPACGPPIYGIRWHSPHPSDMGVEWYFEKDGCLFWTEYYGVAVIQCKRINFIQCLGKELTERYWEVKEIPKMQAP